jgi:hypothetical protein
VVTYQPQNTSAWEEAYGRYLQIAERAAEL